MFDSLQSSLSTGSYRLASECVKKLLLMYKKEKENGEGFMDDLIDRLPFELHVPGYEFCRLSTLGICRYAWCVVTML